MGGEPRDGRFSKKEPKPKHVMQLDRFLGRKTGFANSESYDQPLKELGLSDFVPSHMHRQAPKSVSSLTIPHLSNVSPAARLSSDFSYRYLRKAASVLHEVSCHPSGCSKRRNLGKLGSCCKAALCLSR